MIPPDYDLNNFDTFSEENNLCPSRNLKYATIGDTCYFFETETMTKQEASLNCLSNSGKLWEPKTINSIDKVHTKAIEFSQGPKILSNSGQSTSGHWWTGISDADKEGLFTYDSNGETFPFRKRIGPWRRNEPNGGLNENCVAMNGNNPMEFYDIRCSDGRKYNSICEILPSNPTLGNFTIDQVIIIKFFEYLVRDIQPPNHESCFPQFFPRNFFS